MAKDSDLKLPSKELKRIYARPVLVEYGCVRNLTGGSNGQSGAGQVGKTRMK